jgi:hypothetical protein
MDLPRNRPPRAPIGWPTIDDRAFGGLAGEIVRHLERQTEADPAALLASLLTAVGSAMGPSAHFLADGVKHGTRLNTLIVGDSSRSRKGTSWHRVLEVMGVAAPDWAMEHTASGCSSGEGLIFHAENSKDHVVCVYETEFSRVLKVARREENILSEILRSAWDTGDLRVMTKQPLAVSGAHISIVAHITVEELRNQIRVLDVLNGFGNRFLFVGSRRQRLLPHGGVHDFETLGRFAERLSGVIAFAKNVDQLSRSSSAVELWEEIYYQLAHDVAPGYVGALLARSEAQILRLSVLFALFDSSDMIYVNHLESAHALWKYCADTVRFLFDSPTGNPQCDRLYQAIVASPNGLSRFEAQKVLGKHVYGDELTKLAQRLISQHLISVEQRATPGKRSTVYVAMTA